jgi:hypothetical protein
MKMRTAGCIHELYVMTEYGTEYGKQDWYAETKGDTRLNFG